MPTIDDKELIYQLITNKGHYEDDPQVASIWSYINDWGDLTQAIFYDTRSCDMHRSPHVSNPSLLWSSKFGLTLEGAIWIGLYVQDKERKNEVQAVSQRDNEETVEKGKEE